MDADTLTRPLRIAVRDEAEALDALGRSHGWAPTDGSVTHQDMLDVRWFRAQDKESLWLSGVNRTVVRLLALHDLLKSVAHLYDGHVPVFTPYAPVRSMMMIGARITWMFAPHDPELRAGRCIADRLESMDSSMAIADLIGRPDEVDRLKRRIQSVANRYGFKVKGGRPPILLSPGGQRIEIPTETEAFAAVEGDDESDHRLGSLGYKLASGQVHADPTRLMDHIDPEQAEPDHIYKTYFRVQLSSERLSHLGYWTIQSVRAAVHPLEQRWGWDLKDWRQCHLRSMRMIRQYLPTGREADDDAS